MNLLTLSLAFFAMAAVLGVYLLSCILRNKPTPKGISLILGGLASTALLLLIIFAVIFQRADLIVFILLFIGAALGGIILILRDIQGKTLPKTLALFHGILAISTFVSLFSLIVR